MDARMYSDVGLMDATQYGTTAPPSMAGLTQQQQQDLLIYDTLMARQQQIDANQAMYMHYYQQATGFYPPPPASGLPPNSAGSLPQQQQHPAGSLQHPAGSVQHPTGSLQYPPGSLPPLPPGSLSSLPPGSLPPLPAGSLTSLPPHHPSAPLYDTNSPVFLPPTSIPTGPEGSIYGTPALPNNRVTSQQSPPVGYSVIPSQYCDVPMTTDPPATADGLHLLAQTAASQSRSVVTMETTSTLLPSNHRHTPETAAPSPPSGTSLNNLIVSAILATPTRQITLPDLYRWIERQRPELRSGPDRSWRNTVRSKLSMNEYFIKVRRHPGVKGNSWSIHPACIDDLERLSPRSAKLRVQQYAARGSPKGEAIGKIVKPKDRKIMRPEQTDHKMIRSEPEDLKVVRPEDHTMTRLDLEDQQTMDAGGPGLPPSVIMTPDSLTNEASGTADAKTGSSPMPWRPWL